MIICANSLEYMREFMSRASVDMIFTSPPYAEKRAKHYNTPAADNYVSWFMNFVYEFEKILKEKGSFFLNIKPSSKGGFREIYVLQLILEIVEKTEFNLVDTFCWTKPAFPGAYVGRFKNGFEPVYHFSKCHPRELTFNPLSCGLELSEGAKNRKRKGKNTKNSGMMETSLSCQKHGLARPSNVIFASNTSNKFDHPAVFPEKLVDFFIKSFSNKNDVICDPFAGSGTVGASAKRLGRNYILIDEKKKYIDIIKGRLADEI